MNNSDLKILLQRTAPGRKILASIRLAGEEENILGKGFFKKAFQKIGKVGKVTGKFTGRIAKVAAGLVGIPPGAIDALAKLDPTAKKALDKRLFDSKAGQKAAAAIDAAEEKNKPANFLTNVKPIYIAGTAAGILAILFLLPKAKK